MIVSICEMPEVLRIMRIINIVISIIRIIVPIILIVSAMIDLVRAVTNAELNKISKPIIGKVIAAILVFLIPTFVRLIATIASNNGEYEKCLKDISKDVIENAFIEREEGYVSAAEESEEISDYNTGVYYLTNVKNKDKYKEFAERLAKVKEIIEEKRKPKGPPVLPPILDDGKFNSYPIVAKCDSDTLKYKILNINDDYFVILWAQNPYMQMNSALATDGSSASSGDSILSKEISSNGYGNKCLVATNASFFNMSNGSSVANIIYSKGQLLRNNGSSTLIGITNQNELAEYVNKPLSDIDADGLRNTFVHSHRITINTDNRSDRTNRTIICQIDTNNFFIISGSGSPNYLAYTANQLAEVSACFNLDGGGSRKIYYKLQNSSINKLFGGGRNIPDMMYFVEQ
jgi:hypothetical protein